MDKIEKKLKSLLKELNNKKSLLEESNGEYDKLSDKLLEYENHIDELNESISEIEEKIDEYNYKIKSSVIFKNKKYKLLKSDDSYLVPVSHNIEDDCVKCLLIYDSENCLSVEEDFHYNIDFLDELEICENFKPEHEYKARVLMNILKSGLLTERRKEKFKSINKKIKNEKQNSK